MWKINFKIMEKVKKNNYKCLCKLNTSCPCDEMIYNHECICKLFEEDKNGKDDNG